MSTSTEQTAREKPATKKGKETFRREDIPGYSTSRPDMSNWKEAAAALRVRPFYEVPILCRSVVCGRIWFPIRPEVMRHSMTSILTTEHH
jgi:hypothetical protein